VRDFDRDDDNTVTVDELIAAVRFALDDCPALDYPRDDELRLNQIQVLGSHNSYHIRPDPQILTLLGMGIAQLLSYDHPALDVQFDTQRVRQIEIDVFADPQGGLYASPVALRITSNDETIRIPEMETPASRSSICRTSTTNRPAAGVSSTASRRSSAGRTSIRATCRS
jgi:hypothetical protein